MTGPIYERPNNSTELKLQTVDFCPRAYSLLIAAQTGLDTPAYICSGDSLTQFVTTTVVHN
jgi:hypothetical protein